MSYLLFLARKIQFFLFYDCILCFGSPKHNRNMSQYCVTYSLYDSRLYIRLNWLAYFQHCKCNKTSLQVLSYRNALCVVMFMGFLLLVNKTWTDAVFTSMKKENL